MYETLEVTRNEGVATVWMNRPSLHNAFNDTVIWELTAAFEALGRDETVRVVVLAGRGKSFSAGADLNWMKRAAEYSVDQNLTDARALARMLCTLAFSPSPRSLVCMAPQLPAEWGLCRPAILQSPFGCGVCHI